MPLPQYSFSWEGHHSSVCNELSYLQQNGELVDMTLAADGHMVKVHQLLMALSSPYLKELITSAPCQHPIIFLNNVNHDTLGFILEYVYTGEVLVPMENFGSFLTTAKALRIKGLENVAAVGMGTNVVDQLPKVTTSNRLQRSETLMKTETQSPVPIKKVKITHEKAGHLTLVPNTNQSQVMTDDSFNMDRDDYDDSKDNEQYFNDSSNTNTTEHAGDAVNTSNLQFTVSNRGSLQIILNRYIYNLHSTAHKSGMRRWRCVDYRDNKCPAFVVTQGNIVYKRGNPHKHPFHDRRIISKLKSKRIFSALEDVKQVKEKDEDIEQNAIFIDEDQFNDTQT